MLYKCKTTKCKVVAKRLMDINQFEDKNIKTDDLHYIIRNAGFD